MPRVVTPWSFDPFGSEDPVVLYDGPARLRHEGQEVEGIGQIRFEWRRTPGVRWNFAGHTPAPWLFTDRFASVEFVPTELTADLQLSGDAATWTADRAADYRYSDSGSFDHDGTLGRTDGFAAVEIMLVNYVDQIRRYEPAIDVVEGPWHLTGVGVGDAEGVHERLKRLGGFACTHVVRIERTDGEQFGFEDVAPLLDGLWYLATFATGRDIGIVLPTGLDADGVAVGWETSTAGVDSWRSCLSWLDAFHVRDVEGLFAGWTERMADPFWAPILKRAIRMSSSANNTPIDLAMVTALQVLELLAWAALEVDQKWLDPRDGELSLTGRLRLLLRWAQIDPAIPDRLVALHKLSRGDQNIPDGPAAIVWIRNRSVHPPKKMKSGEPEWPSWEQLVEAWRLALEYADLILLKLLGHDGSYASRLHVNGRATGTVQPVPWATD